MPPYLLSKGAASDLKEIVRYSKAKWGEAQCLNYIAQIDKAALAVSLGEGFYKELNDIYPQLRMKLAGHHYVFCLPRANQPALIVAILHERMDLVLGLQQRLSEQ